MKWEFFLVQNQNEIEENEEKQRKLTKYNIQNKSKDKDDCAIESEIDDFL